MVQTLESDWLGIVVPHDLTHVKTQQSQTVSRKNPNYINSNELLAMYSNLILRGAIIAEDTSYSSALSLQATEVPPDATGGELSYGLSHAAARGNITSGASAPFFRPLKTLFELLQSGFVLNTMKTGQTHSRCYFE